MRFNLSALRGKKIISAKLRIKVKDATSKKLSLKRAQETNWSEKKLTYENKPKFELSLTTFTANSLNSVIDLDVRKSVNLRKGDKVTFGINSSGNDTGAFYSRESGSENKPQLVVEYQ